MAASLFPRYITASLQTLASAGLEKELADVPAHWGHLPISQAPWYVEMLMYLERSH